LLPGRLIMTIPVPHYISGLVRDYVFQSRFARPKIAFDYWSNAWVDGVLDQSPYRKHMGIRRLGNGLNFATVGGREYAQFDNTLIMSARCVTRGEATIVMDFRGGYAANSTRVLLSAESVRNHASQTGNRPYVAVTRRVGSGANEIRFGKAGATLNIPLAGPSAGDGSPQIVAMANDLLDNSAQGKLYGKRQGQAAVESGLITPSSIAMIGADYVVGALRSDETYDARTAVAGDAILLLHRLTIFQSTPWSKANLIVNDGVNLDAYMAALAAYGA